MIPIFMASDEKFTKYMAVTISSIISNTNETCNFNVLDGGITDLSKQKLQQMIANTNHTIEFLSVDKSRFEDFPEIRHFSLNTYFRYLIPELKTEYNKVLYIDTDMMIQGDVKDIFDVNLNSKGIAAVPYMDEIHNPNLYKKYKNKLGISENHLYFNAGLLIIDCDYWRKNNISKILFEKTNELKNIIAMPDQDILNIVFNNNYQELPAQFNYVVDLSLDYIDLHKEISKINGCYILHYTGGRKMRPWLTKGIIGEEYFWTYAQNTPFYDCLKFDLVTNQNSIVKNLIEQKLNKIRRVKLFDFITILKIINKPDKTYVRLFGLIPILKITH